ncbi:MAG: undecaprenyl-phosphate glucose phosphotransferase [Lachnospiraceae bacterium]|nr:undecaprenyl-phosphate glucose phosphotransferase [Lachnospiraceae bacterium]
MIKENQRYLNGLHVVLDIVVTIVSFVLAYYVRFEFEWFAPVRRPGTIGVYYYTLKDYIFPIYKAPLVYIVIGYVILYYIFHLYAPKRFLSRKYELFNIIKANLSGLMIVFVFYYLLKLDDYSRWLMIFFCFINIFLSTLVRNIIRKTLAMMREGGRNLKHIIFVGFSPAATSYIDRIKLNPQWGYRMHGIFDDNMKEGDDYREVPWIGGIDEVEAYLNKNNLDETIITLDIKEYNKLERIVSICEKSGTHTKFVPDYYNFITTKPYMEDLSGLPVINIRNVPLSNTGNKIIKRIMDIIGSIVAIILFSPVMLIVALLIKITSPGPIIFNQVRVGLHNKNFNMYKFRSMRVQTAEEEKKGWTTKDDPRVTKIGKFIRKTSIDELPQFFNVLKGDMSLIGPRPERPQFVEQYKEEIPKYMIKHQVRPGITGWAQVNGFRGDTSIKLRIEHDIYYIENWTLGFDIKILFLTVFKGFVNENAY